MRVREKSKRVALQNFMQTELAAYWKRPKSQAWEQAGPRRLGHDWKTPPRLYDQFEKNRRRNDPGRVRLRTAVGDDGTDVVLRLGLRAGVAQRLAAEGARLSGRMFENRFASSYIHLDDDEFYCIGFGGFEQRY
ncbi:hypothetical protein EVAR_58818_1 [Eumeta japonica]|uniref:Uncharacterized protein n=1 Tax=Eumeta variegata TaxID=151549 RepID=A0A4C1YN00_EUMVA|nr:hypothetical protein EVAR_58818_1 [Eumeta japonica]